MRTTSAKPCASPSLGSGIRGGASFPLIPPSSTADPSIHVENDFVAGTMNGDGDGVPVAGHGGGGCQQPERQRPLSDPWAGQGNIMFSAAVRAKNIPVIAGGTVFIDGVSSYSVGGERDLGACLQRDITSIHRRGRDYRSTYEGIAAASARGGERSHSAGYPRR